MLLGISVRFSGNLIFVRETQSLKVSYPNVVKVFGNVTVVSPLPLNARLPILVISDGNVINDRAVQFRKALAPISATPLLSTNTPSWVVESQVDAFWSTFVVHHELKLFKSAVAV